MGHKRSEFISPDVIMSRMLWSVYVPLGYTCLHFGGDLEKEKMARGIRPILGAARTYYSQAPASSVEEFKKQVKGRLKGEFGRNVIIEDKEVEGQMENEMMFSQRVDQIQAGEVTGIGTLPSGSISQPPARSTALPGSLSLTNP